ncbi:hypothetical protein HDF18_03175 [Mucilaginibacter sp. X5P1]|uniref:hypothetical protein n=1 Tax=Mucilaginibacter sp. X5P1 TaxID=2723088 RepID=UPI001614B86F|nr:hypothetical protein [Mucilaginibacter sp. X5P1]MBB6136613.1 hypothetical protein [Mucilaginibacter sp. X5P1]
MSEKFTATDDNRTYSFFLINQDSGQITIDMYNSAYTFIKKEAGWINHINNKMVMAPNLINAVIEALP